MTEKITNTTVYWRLAIMMRFIKAVYESRKVMVAEPVVEASPMMLTVAFKGFIHLRSYAGAEPRFEGGEAKELRALLNSLGQGVQVMVKTHPTLERFKEAAYEFSAVKRYADKEGLEKAVGELKDAGMVQDASMPLTRPSQWKA